MRIFILLAALPLLAACDDGESTEDAGFDAGCFDCGIDGGRPSDGGPMVSDMDAAPADAGDGELDAAPPSSDAAEGAPCGFNRECGAEQRCECDEATGCFCTTGPRGTGELGDPCTDGNDCASSVCVEGPDAAYYCTEECVEEVDCDEPLPRCLDVTFVGRICVRTPPEDA